MIDLHTHILPGIDDGPETVAGSIAFARAAVDAGTTEVVATPHVTWEIPNDAAIVARGVAALGQALDEAGVELQLRTGGEVAITRAADLPDEDLDALHLGGGEWLLAECPLTIAATGFDHVLHHLQARGHRIVLAHPERSPAIQRDPDVLRRLVDAGMLASITASSLTGAFGRTVQEFTYDLVVEGLVHNVASDAHSAERRRPGMRRHLEAAAEDLPGLLDLADWWCVEVPRAVLDGGPVPRRVVPLPERRRRGLLGRLGRRG